MPPLPCPVLPSNPFSTKFVCPGALAYEFAPNGEVASAAQFLHQLARHNWRGAIVGPHGSGKSTLLATLLGELTRTTKVQVHHVALHDGQRGLPFGWVAAMRERARNGKALLVVDGYEQLAWPARVWLGWIVRAMGLGVLVTAHQPVAWPTLMETSTSPELAVRLARQVVASSTQPTLPAEVITHAFQETGGNQREVFFTLYDWFERQR